MNGFGQPLHNLNLYEGESCSGLQLQRERKSHNLINLLRQISDAEPGKHLVTRRRRHTEELDQLQGWDVTTLVKRDSEKRPKKKTNRLVLSEPNLEKDHKLKLPNLTKPNSLYNIKKKVITTSSRAPFKYDHNVRQLEYDKSRRRVQKSSFLKVDNCKSMRPIRPMMKQSPLAGGKKDKNKLKMDELANSFSKSVDKFKSTLKNGPLRTSSQDYSPDIPLNKFKSTLKCGPVWNSSRDHSPDIPLEKSKPNVQSEPSALSQDQHTCDDGDRVVDYYKKTHPKDPSKSPYLKAAEFQKHWPVKPANAKPSSETEAKPDQHKLKMGYLAEAYSKSREKFKARLEKNEVVGRSLIAQHDGDRELDYSKSRTGAEILKDVECNTIQPFKPIPKLLAPTQGEPKNKKQQAPKKKSSIVLPDGTELPAIGEPPPPPPDFQVQGSIAKIQRKKKSDRPPKARWNLPEPETSTVASKKKKPKKMKSEQVKLKSANNHHHVDKVGPVGLTRSIRASGKPLPSFPNRYESLPQIKKQNSRSVKRKSPGGQCWEEPDWSSTAAREAVAELAGDYLLKAWMVDQEFSSQLSPSIAAMLRYSANKLL